MKARQLFGLILIVPPVYADTSLNAFNVDFSASSIRTDNANKYGSPADSAKLSELQNLYEVGVKGKFTNDLVAFVGGYALSDQQYSENSQPSYTSLVGSLQLDIGNNYQPLHLNIAHANESLLNAPDAIDLSVNREERSTLSVVPSLRLRPSDADSIEASLRFVDVAYDKQEKKDSAQTAVQLAWLREINKISDFKLALISSEVSFEISPLFDYKLESAIASYSTKLRYLSYSVAVGANRVVQESKGADFTRPNYQLSVTYENVFNKFGFNIGRRVSDSSSGNGAMFGGTPTTTSENGIDIIDITDATLSWSTDWLCEKCNIGFSVGRSEENYQALDEDAVVDTLGANASYRVGRNGALSMSYRANERSFDETSLRKSFSDKNYEIAYSHRFIKKLSMNAFVRKYIRDSISDLATYDENLVGIKLTYSF